jgi:2-pyrone-4,6-dicarboxylate lactonase
VKKPLRVNYPPDPNPRKPRLKVPSGAWDSHFHIIGPPHQFPYAPTRHSTPPAAPFEHYSAVAAVLGFERGVVVQSSAHGADNAAMLDAVARSDGRLRGIVLEDTVHDGGDVKKLKAAGVIGVRLNVGAHDSELPFEPARYDNILAAAADASWIVALHFNPDNLIKLADWVRQIPLPTIIDNYGGLDARKGVDQPALRTLVDLAQEPHVWLKTAAAYRMVFKGATFEQISPIGQAVHAASPDRVIWGTDWPHSQVFEPGVMPNDGDQVDWLLDFVPDETRRHKLLVDNPKRLFDTA